MNSNKKIDEKKAFLNIIVSIVLQILIIVVGTFSKKLLIKNLGEEYNSVYSVFVTLLIFLGSIQLAISSTSSIIMCKYVLDKDYIRLGLLYRFCSKICYISSFVIFIFGLLLLPIIKFFIKGYDGEFNLQLCFFLILVANIINYLSNTKVAVINSYKNNYISSTISSICQVIRYLLEILSVYLTNSFYVYLASSIIASLLQVFLTTIHFNKHHKIKIHTKGNDLEKSLKDNILSNTKAMFLNKLGDLVITNFDCIAVSLFTSISMSKKYYLNIDIILAITGILNLFFTPLTNVLAHLFENSDNTKLNKYFNYFHYINCIIGIIFYLLYYSIIDYIVKSLFGAQFCLTRMITLFLTFSYFVRFIRNAINLFKDASGAYYHNKVKSISEGLFNIIVCILIVILLKDKSEEIKLIGILISNILTTLIIDDLMEPYVLYKHTFEKSPKKFYIVNYIIIFGFFLLLLINYKLEYIFTKKIFNNIMSHILFSLLFASIPVITLILFSSTLKEAFKIKLRKLKLKKIIRKEFNLNKVNASIDINTLNIINQQLKEKFPNIKCVVEKGCVSNKLVILNINDNEDEIIYNINNIIKEKYIYIKKEKKKNNFYNIYSLIV